ncbi:uncharacterized protein LOC112539951 [Tetranychus urticae]|uniref:uncharacterized protein LOC112539951 n=1 Tax=Tetranychus urticae TaxID=32264 RepID=UPI000D6578B8|nr:uncharacterized protein LOC112539951 [Tetranychus urticae]
MFNGYGFSLLIFTSIISISLSFKQGEVSTKSPKEKELDAYKFVDEYDFAPLPLNVEKKHVKSAAKLTKQLTVANSSDTQFNSTTQSPLQTTTSSSTTTTPNSTIPIIKSSPVKLNDSVSIKQADQDKNVELKKSQTKSKHRDIPVKMRSIAFLVKNVATDYTLASFKLGSIHKSYRGKTVKITDILKTINIGRHKIGFGVQIHGLHENHEHKDDSKDSKNKTLNVV